MSGREIVFEPLPPGTSSDVDNSSKTPKPPNHDLRFKLCICCFWICIGIVGCLCFQYYSSVMEERHEIDISNTSIAEPLLDKSTDKHVNCTQGNPCKYTCIYVHDHFNRIPEDCEYTDYFGIISTVIEILLLVAILSCLCPNNK